MAPLQDEIASSLKAAGLVPGPAQDLILQGFDPKTKLSVAFGERQLELGNFFRASECKTAPSVSFQAEACIHSRIRLQTCSFPRASKKLTWILSPARRRAHHTYLLLLIDPDAPTPDDPKFAFWRHWVVPGLKPTGSGASAAEETKPVLTAYLGPGPKDDSKPHRYLFLLFREPSGLALNKEDVGGEEFVERRSFKAASFVEKNSLKLAALNWMTCAGDGWKEQ